jgi:hypothetical protein
MLKKQGKSDFHKVFAYVPERKVIKDFDEEEGDKE